MRHPLPLLKRPAPPRCLLLAAGIALTLAVAPARAAADSLVYVAGGHVDVANADGSQARAVSPQGNWAWPSESDNGTIAALSTDTYDVSEFDQQGNSLLSSPIVTPASTFNQFADYYVDHIRISPDASRLAYNVINCCGFSGESAFLQPTTAGNSNWGDFTDDYINPVWVDASTANDPYVNSKDGLGLGSNGYNWSAVAANSCCQYGIWNADNASDNGGWKTDSDIPNSDWEFEVAYTRNLKRLALFLDDSPAYTGVAHNVEIVLESVDWGNNATSTDDCTIPLQAGSYSQIPQLIDSISYSSDGSTLAWADSTGIYEANVANPSNCAAVKSSVHLAVPGGAYPYFGAAALSPVAAGGSGAGSGGPGSGSGSGGSGSGNAGSGSGNGAAHNGGPTQTVSAPNTKITRAIINHRTRTATFHLKGSGGSGKLTYKCRLDHGRWKKCATSVTYKRLRRGRHTFSVEAVDHRGKVDRTPATKRFKV